MSTARLVFVEGAYPDVGKGIFSSSLGYLLKEAGYTVSIVKFDGHFTTSHQAMNPYHPRDFGTGYHGEEVFVMKDGFHASLDLGNYERFLDQQTTNRHNITTGRLFQWYLELESQGKFAFSAPNYGTLRGMLSEWLLSECENDFVVVEAGGTVGDRELELLVEAVAKLRSTGKADVRCIMLSPYLWQETGGAGISFRSKITRQAFERSWRLGIRPDLIGMRFGADIAPDPQDLGYIAHETGLDVDKDIFSICDQPTVFAVPGALHDQGVDERVLAAFGLSRRGTPTRRLEKYCSDLERIANKPELRRVGIAGWTASSDSNESLLQAVEHAAVAEDIRAETIWLDREHFDSGQLETIDALIVGEGLVHIDDKRGALKFARENQLPCLAVAFGFDLFVSEYARSVLDRSLAVTELEETGSPAIERIEYQAGGRPVVFRDSSIQCRDERMERVRTNSKLDAGAVALIESSELDVLAQFESDGSPCAVKVAQHPYCIAVKYHPEYLSRPGVPHPLFQGLFRAVKNSARS